MLKTCGAWDLALWVQVPPPAVQYKPWNYYILGSPKAYSMPFWWVFVIA